MDKLRNPYFKGCIAPKAITTIANHGTECHVFEGFMDYLSYLVLYGKCDAVVLNSIVNIPQVLPVLERYSQVLCHLDNDVAGRMSTQKIVTALGKKCTDTAREYEGNKDLNKYLINNATPQRRKSFVR